MTTTSTHEAAREAARRRDGTFGEQPHSDPGVLPLDPGGGFGDQCVTGPTPERFTAAVAGELSERYVTDPENDYVILEQIGLIQAKRLADVIARLYPQATEVRLVRRGGSAEYLRVDWIEPMGEFQPHYLGDPAYQLVDDEACNLSRFADSFRDRCIDKPSFNAEVFTFRVADMQAIAAHDLDHVES